jgi:DNA invertase Pin-like site-specific DNA recombinase
MRNVRKAKYVAYYRVSTQKQGKSGLGIAAQQEAVHRYVAGAQGELIESFTETESGRTNDRPELHRALELCRLRKACLVVAKMDRLTRSVSFLLALIDKADRERGVVFCDLPTIPEGPTGKFLLTQMASVAELEAGLIAQRTRAALQAAKARGKRLGRRDAAIAQYAAEGGKAGSLVRTEKADQHAADLARYVKAAKAKGAESLREVADALNERGLLTPRGGQWSAVQVQRLLKRLGL